jgi:Cu/Ag efflux protein CusF
MKKSAVVQAFRPAVTGRPKGLHYNRADFSQALQLPDMPTTTAARYHRYACRPQTVIGGHVTSPRAQFIVVVGMALALCVSAGQAQTAEKKAHTFRGKVEKVDAENKMLVVNGEKVEGWMAAMTMTYVVEDKADVFKTVKVGDQITAKVYDGDFTLHDVQVDPPKSPAKGKAAANNPKKK